MSKKDNPHYVNNADFSAAVVEYVKSVNDALESGDPAPQVTNYIAECFLKISEGLSHKSNFIRYTYRDEMAMDAVENCLRAIRNYNIETATRTGKPNAFSYFTQIAWFAFLRRIAKEKKQYDVKMKYLSESGLEDFMIDPNEDPESAKAIQSYVEQLRKKMDDFKETSSDPIPEKKKFVRSRNQYRSDSDLSDFFDLNYDIEDE